MALELTVVDAFTSRPFSGNPAAVCLVEAFPDEALMQDVASEMNLAETAFVAPRADGSFDLRWFTPAVEVDLCGHATLAAAHVVGGTARFHTRSGLLSCSRSGDGWIEMDFPSDRPSALDLPDALPFDEVRWYGSGRFFLLVELASATSVRTLVPDANAIARLGQPVVITSAGDRPGIDCVSRVFAPTLGIAEDPVTGSAHCLLASYWADRAGRSSLVGEQASSRGGVVRMTARGERVILAGEAVTVSTVRFG
jgi:predicted PhzF superfamily epimerase YddE/YHI9